MDNDYLMNREKQKTGEWYSGIEGIAIQDSSLQESMGLIVDRTKERLVPADSGIIKARQKLRKAAIALRDQGVIPPGVDPAHHRALGGHRAPAGRGVPRRPRRRPGQAGMPVASV